MRIKAVLGNAEHPEYGVVEIPLPIPKEQYDSTIRMLEGLGIGDVIQRDCKVEELVGAYPVFRRLEGQQINVDELDYLMKLADSFFGGEDAQYQGMAYKLGLTDIKDFINLHFSFRQATVITDFSDLEAIGKEHYMNLHGGSALVEELEHLDGTETALLLIEGNEGIITPYGVVYDNGMKLEQLYRGKEFPAYAYEPCLMVVTMVAPHKADCSENETWLFLPAAEQQIQRAMARAGIDGEEAALFHLRENNLPEEIKEILDFEQESIFDLNALCAVYGKLSPDDQEKLRAVVALAQPEDAAELRRLTAELELFDFVPGVHTPEEYGRYMIRDSGHFDYDPNLEPFYDFKGYALQRIDEEQGRFTEHGYIAYQGTLPLEELMRRSPVEQSQQEQGPMMGGMG